MGILLSGIAASAQPFRDGDRVCFLGDSITKQGGYHEQILLFYATRLPDVRVQMWNCGIAGDTAAGGVKRYDWDVAPYKPTVVSIMMGMNDVGRGYYASDKPDAAILARRQQAIERNIANMRKLVDRVTGDGARAILITPSLYDQTGQQESTCLFGVNDALKACAEGVRQIAKQHADNVEVIEFNPPMAAINAKWQAKDPAFTLIGKDRVHPGAVGHLVMAYLFLKAQGVPGTVADMELNAKEKTVVKQENCRVTDLAVSADRVAFSCLERALPFPVDQREEAALKLVPFTADLNREIIRISGLREGKYELRIDGTTVLTGTADDFAEGINLAVARRTPQYKQALAVAEIVDKRHRLGKVVRTYALLKQQFFPEQNDLDPAQEKAILEANLAKLKGKDSVWSNYRRAMIESYLGTEGGKADAEEQCARLLGQIYRLSRPQPHRYELLRATESR
jgi:lysophospholipase L1-like esterase